RVGFNSQTGIINKADILINDSFANFNRITASPNLSANGYAYLGDIVTHEIGHLLGLAHTEMPGSSMVYSIVKGQYTPSEDEFLAVEDIYGNSKTRISG